MSNLFTKLKAGLTKSSDKLISGLKNIFTKRKLDQEALDEFEELLISADLGVEASNYIIREFAKNRFDKEISQEEVKSALVELLENLLAQDNKFEINNKPEIILICGVNGNGKTTTIGKLANLYKAQGKEVVIAACDTFRAAAVEQLDIWAKRANVQIIKGAHQEEPASVAYKAVEYVVNNAADILLIDTAGRLQNKTNLMDELAKIDRVIKKLIPDAPHKIIQIVDATTGQNAISQVELFSKVVNVSGLIITKLDGTAKAGILVALNSKFKLPVYYIGIGETIDDLQEFDYREFAKNLVN